MTRLPLLVVSDPIPNLYDIVVGYDGGADYIVSYGGMTPDIVGPLVDGAVFTRGPSQKKHTALFIGGANIAAGEELLAAVTKRSFGNFRVSVMPDSHGSNTTAAAGAAQIAKAVPLASKKVVVLAGTGPVGQRAAAPFAKEGAQVSLTSRDKQRAAAACRLIQARFGVSPTPLEAADNDARGAIIGGADVAFAARAIGIWMFEERHWRDEWTIELIADCNAQQRFGVAGIDATDKGYTRQQKRAFCALGIGGLKLKLRRACIAQLFQSSDQVLDAEVIYALAKP